MMITAALASALGIVEQLLRIRAARFEAMTIEERRVENEKKDEVLDFFIGMARKLWPGD